MPHNRKTMIIMKLACFLLACSAITCLAADVLSPAEQSLLKRLNAKRPPADKAQAANQLKQKGNKLQEMLNEKKKSLDTLEKVTLVKMEKNVDLLKRQIEQHELNRQVLQEEITCSKEDITTFTKTLDNFLSEHFLKTSSFCLGLPVFPRSQVFVPESPKGKTLLVDMEHMAPTTMMAMGGEILCKSTGKIQFVILQPNALGKENKSVPTTFKLLPAGEEIQLTENDKDEKSGGNFHRIALFNKNFVRMQKGDFFGVLVENSLGITFDSLGTGTTAIIPFDETNASLPQQISLTPPQDTHQLKPSGEEDSWKRFSKERNEGHSFSFNLWVSIIE